MNLGKTQPPEPPRIFISHAWEDKTLVRRLEAALKAAGTEVWVDHIGVRGGDNLPERISEALDWCNTLLLVWSNAAAGSRWVKLEWTNAIALDKLIIPCPSDKTPLPSILAHKAYIAFSDADIGLRELLRALQLTPPTSRAAQDDGASPARALHSPVMQTPPIPKPSPKRPAPVQLRATPINPLPEEAVRQMLREKDFYDSYWNASGKGLAHQYESMECNGAKLVIDHATGLTWQQGGSENRMTFEKTADYIRQLNTKNYGGYTDWRLPTLEEAMSLMEPRTNSHGLHMDAKFDDNQSWIWTVDIFSAEQAWSVGFYIGFCSHVDVGDLNVVRAVRS